MSKVLKIMFLTAIIMLHSICFGAITEQQGEDVAEFATKFIEEGNARRDERGFPLLTYALTGSWSGNVKLRTAGYNGQMTYLKNNGYYIAGGRYLDLGNKWCMDCGTTVLFLLKNTVGLEVLTKEGEPWHVIDIYNDACKGDKSEVFEFVYRDVSVGGIDYKKLKKGDVIGYYTGHGNHGMLYLGDGLIAHANRDMIRSTGNNKISGFQVNKLLGYFAGGARVRVYRIKDGVIPEDYVSNSIVTWPDTGERVDLLGRATEEELALNLKSNEIMLLRKEKEEEALRLQQEEEERLRVQNLVIEQVYPRLFRSIFAFNSESKLNKALNPNLYYTVFYNNDYDLAKNQNNPFKDYKLASN